MNPTTLAALFLFLALPAHAAFDTRELDRDLEPCADFYRYVNGKWLATAAIPDDRSTWGTFSFVQRNNEAILMTALDEALKDPPAAGTPARVALDYYASGLDTQAIESAGLEPIAALLAKAAAVKDADSLADALAALHAHRINAAFEFNVRADAHDATRYLAQIVQGGLGLPERDYYFREDAGSVAQRKAYVAHVARVFTLAGDEPAQAQERAEAVLAFESELARQALTAVERRDPEANYHKLAITQIESQAPGFPWRRYFGALGAAQLDEANLGQPSFFQNVARMAQSRTPGEWRTYLRWQILHAAASRLPRAFAEADFDFFERELRGRKAIPQRDGYVVERIAGRYGEEPIAEGMGQIFVAKAFSPQAKQRALELVRNVKAALEKRLETLDWMSPETRARALEKLNAMDVKIGYPDRWRDYSSSTIGKHVYAGNWLRAGEFEHRRLLARLGAPVDRGEWWMAAHIVNAYYSRERNEIVFPAGILQPPFFDMKADDALNYGAIGAVIGHEITHGFDDNGRRFDAHGNLRDWWTAQDAKGYLVRAKRIEDQYSAYEGVDGLRVNGKLTLGENISDVGGIKIAYLALQQALEGKDRRRIDGLTPEQRFFASFALTWRTAYRPAYERLLIRTNGHSPARYRVQGPLSHMPEFAKAFGCDAPRTAASQPSFEIW